MKALFTQFDGTLIATKVIENEEHFNNVCVSRAKDIAWAYFFSEKG